MFYTLVPLPCYYQVGSPQNPDKNVHFRGIRFLSHFQLLFIMGVLVFFVFFLSKIKSVVTSEDFNVLKTQIGC